MRARREKDINEILGEPAGSIRAMIAAGNPLLSQPGGDPGGLPNLDFLALWELFLTEVVNTRT
jgi:hypothetical protein